MNLSIALLYLKFFFSSSSSLFSFFSVILLYKETVKIFEPVFDKLLSVLFCSLELLLFILLIISLILLFTSDIIIFIFSEFWLSLLFSLLLSTFFVFCKIVDFDKCLPPFLFSDLLSFLERVLFSLSFSIFSFFNVDSLFFPSLRDSFSFNNCS